MGWWGKVLGGAFGALVGGPLGAVLGAALGHSFDQGRAQNFDREPALGRGEQERVQAAFFTATFAIMGHLAKADGRVSEAEIRHAREVMARLGLPEAARQLAMDLFNQGKLASFDRDAALGQLKSECGHRRNLLRLFLEIQIAGALADRELHGAELGILQHLAAGLGLAAELQHLLTLHRVGAEFGAGFGGESLGEAPPSPARKLADAHAVLDLAEGASDGEVKRAYKRLMAQHHPDKLVAQGLPEEMMKAATEKTIEIKAAYDTIRAARGL
ncbi:MAG: co-chaperone DjlA [Gammaproteobacteria bacterium]|nr:co-chaperone DjlA [Gammaproteobacteria bacterium]